MNYLLNILKFKFKKKLNNKKLKKVENNDIDTKEELEPNNDVDSKEEKETNNDIDINNNSEEDKKWMKMNN